MQPLKCEEILKATYGELISGSSNSVIENISTDSRSIKNGDFFIPIIGESFNGHEFISDSYTKGAIGAFTEEDGIKVSDDSKILIRVKDTTKALGDIAKYYRTKYKIPFIGITGSVGKTSTKDMIASGIGKKLKVLKTEGNFNNQIGVPLTILNLDEIHEAAVIEMGMRGFGEIGYLSSIVKPDIGVITNIGVSHIEKLGSRQNILKAKMEILEDLNEKGLLVLNGDDSLLSGFKDILKIRTVFFGLEEYCTYQAYDIAFKGENGISFNIIINDRTYNVKVPSPGKHNVYNALAGIAVGLELGISAETIIEGIADYSASSMRLDIQELNGVKIINDCYNASPNSMEAAIDVLFELGHARRKVAVLGSMLELGELSKKAHKTLGKFAINKNIDYIFTVGEFGRQIAEGALENGASIEKVTCFKDSKEAAAALKEFLRQGDIVLIKGSRAMKMEQIVNALVVKE